MSLQAVPVVMPFRLERGVDAAVHTLHVECVATTAQAARAAAQLLAATSAILRFGQRPSEILVERAAIGAPRHGVLGPYAYIITRGDRIPHLAFPPRLDNQTSPDFERSLEGLDADWVLGVVLDCAPLSYINTSGLSALTKHAARLNLHLMRLPPPIAEVMRIVGVDQLLPCHSDLKAALEGVLAVARPAENA